MTRGGERAASVPPFRLPGLDPGLGFLGFTRRHEEGSARGRAGVSRRDRRGKEGAEMSAPAATLTASSRGAGLHYRRCEAHKGRGKGEPSSLASKLTT